MTAVVFDVGNVLYGWDPDRFFRARIADEGERARFVAESDFLAWHEELDGGRSFAEAALDLSGRFPDYAELIRAWSDDFGSTITGPVPGVHEIVEALDERGVPLFAITNFSADFWPPFAERESAFFARFRDIVVSGREKLLKPHPELYRRALDRFGIAPDEALFVDDRPINVHGAQAVGMRGHLFTGAEGLRRRLEAEGLL
ncbi:HAD family hydrolase [Allosphingosinicella sp.]|jgi:2-haloacid dehalogenase|uniref:HAD family hydrolase n=1 Tax=Allosphingosinicella sp. TaxID=2823234 RepID=UPI002F0AF264